MTLLMRWVQASRLSSQSYIFLPILLGQACWVALGNTLDWGAFVLVQLFGLFNQLYIVYANDYADHEDDPKNTMPTMFSGGSRVLVDKLLKPRDLKLASIVMASLCMLVSLLFALFYRAFLAIPLVFLALLLLWLYSFKPVRLSYRGGGELLQALGTAIVLPLMGFLAQAGSLDTFPWIIVVIAFPASLACAIATAIPDEPADRLYNKRTLPVILGAFPAKLLVVLLELSSILMFYLVLKPFNGKFWSSLFYMLPVLSVIFIVRFIKAKPGTRAISFFGFSAILATLSVIGSMAQYHFTS